MRTGRIEAFSDGVMAVLITIMVLELPKPDGVDWSALAADVFPLLAYVLSFALVGVYWNNHHHLFQAATRVTGGVLWANLHFLFWLSLLPWATAWVSEESARPGRVVEPVPVIVYGVLLLLAGAAFGILEAVLVRSEGAGSVLAMALGRDWKSKASMVLYVLGVLAAIVSAPLGLVLYAAVAVIWFVPDRRIERVLARAAPEAEGD